jgi:hypothetical protein
MIYLNPPYFLIDGVSIFPDHADPLQFYFLPMAPRLTLVPDPTTGAQDPSIQLIEYEGAAGTGGFINFDVNIGLDQDKLDDVTQKLQQAAHLDGTPILSPVTFVDGSVKLLILGAETPAPGGTAGVGTGASGASSSTAGAGSGSAGTPASPRFVIKMQGATKPALFGDNQATFSVQLDQYGATVLEAALKGAMAPIAVIYSLDFVALRPAFNVHLQVDWTRVQTHMDDSFHTGFLFFSSDIEKVVDKLIEDQVIVLQIDTFVTDAEGGKSLSDDRDRAVSEVYEMIKNTFFESSLPPPQPGQPDDWSKAEGAAQAVSAMALTGGAAALGCFSRKSVDMTRTDQKTLNVDISERTSVQRTIYPQGHLNGLLSTLEQGQSLDRYILKVDLDNPWFTRRTIKVVSYADFVADQVASIDVTLTYNGLVKTVTLTAAAPSASVDWSSVLQNGQMVRPVTYTYTVNFAGVDTTQRPGQLTSTELTEIGDALTIQPRSSLYAATVVPIRADSLPFDRYPSVVVDVRYNDATNNVRDQSSWVLDAKTPGATWQLFLIDPANRAFDYQLTFTLASGGTSVTPWVTTDSGKIDIGDPFPAKSQLIVMPGVNWVTTDQVLVHLAYPGKDNPVVQQNFIFNSGAAASQTFVADRQDPTQTAVYYEARIISKNGQVYSVPGSVTTDSFLIIQPGMKGHQILRVQPQAVDFASIQVTEIDVQVRYQDPANGFDESAAFKLAGQRDVQQFPYDYLDPTIPPQYRCDVQLDNGQTRSFDWQPAGGSTVTIDLSNL